MEQHAKTARYGYHVPHLILSGLAGGVAVLLAGVALLVATSRSPWLMAMAGGCVLTGLVLLAYTIALRWLVVRGRPLITERMVDTVPWTGTDRVLDVGCGPGLALVKVARRLTSGRVTGLDKWMVIHGERYNSKDITLENARIEGVADRVDVQDGDAGQMPFADDSFDVVVSSFVFHHMSREVRHQAIREVARVTRPGGRILITDDDATVELAKALRELGMTDVSQERMTFPMRLLKARKPAQTERAW
jgi:SAM-dependent methyltransferase